MRPEARANISLRNEIARRERDAPLLQASGVLPELPTVDELIERRERAGDEVRDRLQRMADHANSATELYRSAILDAHGADALAAADDAFHSSRHLPRLGPEYRADFYCEQLAALRGCTKLEAYTHVRQLRVPIRARVTV